MSIESYPNPNGVLTSLIWRKTAVGGETSLSGYDNASQALSYTPGQEQVYLNGILLVRGSDYTATNGTSITGLTALTADDFVQINCYNNFSVASLPAASITGEITNSQITSLATTKLTGTITNAQLAGSIANDKLANSSITINGSAVSLGGSATIAGGSAQDTAPTSPTEGQLWLDTNGTLATTAFVEKSTLTTTGDLFYASSASTPARLGIGSTSQVLTVSGGVPTWSTPASSGGLTLLSTTTLSGTSVDISNISQDYINLRIYVKGMYGTVDNLQPKIRFNNDSNSRYVWGITGVRIGNGATDSGASGSSTTSVYFANGSAGTAFNRLNFISLYLPRYTDTSNQFFTMQIYGSADATNTNWGPYWVSGVYDAQAAISSINLIRDNGSFGGGTVYIYGEK